MTPAITSALTRPAFAMPGGACDSHVHLIGPHAQFPLVADRLYTPGPATLADLRAHQAALGLERAVVVHATPQNEDCRYLLQVLAQAPRSIRGVVPASDRFGRAELLAMRALGVRGMRLNFETGEMRDAAQARELLGQAARRAHEAGLHLQLHANAALLTALGESLARLPCIVVIDHMGRFDPALALDGPDFLNLLSLLNSGRVYLKLSAFHRVSARPDYVDLAPAIRAFAGAASHRLLWGSDWPHPQRPKGGNAVSDDIDPYRQEDDGSNLNILWRWVGNAAVMREILVTNPENLFDF